MIRSPRQAIENVSLFTAAGTPTGDIMMNTVEKQKHSDNEASGPPVSLMPSFEEDEEFSSTDSSKDITVLRLENENLRKELLQLRVQVKKLKWELEQTKLDKTARPSREARKTSSKRKERGGQTVNMSFFGRGGRIRSQSLGTDSPLCRSSPKEKEFELTVGSPYLESHQSLAGLHQRYNADKKEAEGRSTIQNEASRLIESETTISYYSGNGSDLEASNISKTDFEDEEFSDSSFWAAVFDRAGWLVGLLVLQSLSSFIIKRNEDLLTRHVVIVQFLTMLVGAGGNAGNQATVRVIRGLATGIIHDGNVWKFLEAEFRFGITISAILGVAGCVRAAVFLIPWLETLSITLSLFTIVWISTIIGSFLPLLMKHMHIDPAHSSTTIQVVMDILGVTITVHICSLILGSAFANTIHDEAVGPLQDFQQGT